MLPFPFGKHKWWWWRRDREVVEPPPPPAPSPESPPALEPTTLDTYDNATYS